MNILNKQIKTTKYIIIKNYNKYNYNLLYYWYINNYNYVKKIPAETSNLMI